MTILYKWDLDSTSRAAFAALRMSSALPAIDEENQVNQAKRFLEDMELRRVKEQIQEALQSCLIQTENRRISSYLPGWFSMQSLIGNSSLCIINN